MKRTIVLILSWAMVLACAVGIFLFSSQSGADSAQLSGSVMAAGPLSRILTTLFGEQGHNVLRKFAHCFIYAALMFLTYHALYRTRRRRRLSAVLPFLLCALYAVSDEIHQAFVPERAGRIFDVGVDLIGCAVGGLCFYALAKLCLYITKKQKKRECKP